MDQVLQYSKEFEVLVKSHDPFYRDEVIGIEIVKKFIIDNGLIVYGGSAIDLALRLKGDKIYPDDMLAVPDLDFYSPNNIEHAYQLADILYERGYKESRAINALHMETMRVDLADNHFIADITYRPREIFDKLPTLTYNGMKIIHPVFQRIDLHSSLAFPYDNVPREVVFDRWSKDVKRFNLLDKYYPVVTTPNLIQMQVCKIPFKFAGFVFGGFAGYSLIYHSYARSMALIGASIHPGVIPSPFEIEKNQFAFESLNGKFEILHSEVDLALTELTPQSVEKFETFIHIIPERVECKMDPPVTIFSTKNKLVGFNNVSVGEHSFRVANAQYMLKHFIALHFMHAGTPKLSNMYLTRYLSILAMIASFGDDLAKLERGQAVEMAKHSPLFPSLETYGTKNINLSMSVALNRMRHDIDGEELIIIPRNYYPGRSIPAGRTHPEFDYASADTFQESGKLIG